MIAFLRHYQYLADRPPVSDGRRDAEQTFGVRGELGPSYPLGRMQVEEAILEGEALAITLDPFEGAKSGFFGSEARKCTCRVLGSDSASGNGFDSTALSISSSPSRSTRGSKPWLSLIAAAMLFESSEAFSCSCWKTALPL